MDDKTEIPKDECNTKSDLDLLLDDALEDFSKPIPQKKHDGASETSVGNSNVWTEEFIAAVTQNFETTMKTVLSQQKTADENGSEDSALNSADLGTMSAEFAKFAEAAAKAATSSTTDKDFTSCLTETMQQLAKNKEEAQAVPTAEEIGKLFDSFGFGDPEGEEGKDISGLFPLMQSMLENILSKDVLYPPLKDIVVKYPDWLADNRISLSEEEYSRYNKQYDIMKQVVEKFESEAKEDSDDVKAQISENILILMQRLQELGQPPKELVGDFEPIIALDEKGNPKLPDLSSFFSGLGFPSISSPDGADAGQPSTSQPSQETDSTANEEQCILM